jgi:hypothetical protein
LKQSPWAFKSRPISEKSPNGRKIAESGHPAVPLPPPRKFRKKVGGTFSLLTQPLTFFMIFYKLLLKITKIDVQNRII